MRRRTSTTTADTPSLGDQIGDIDELVEKVAGGGDTESTTTSGPANSPTTRPPTTETPSTVATTTTAPSKPCGEWRVTRYIPANSSLVFERNGVEVELRRVYYKQLTLQVSSSDGTYRESAIDPDATLFEGLEVATTSLGMGWEWNYFTEQFEMNPGQVSTVVRVQDCWSYTWGPPDVF